MVHQQDVFTITIRKRTWWFWAVATACLLLEVVLLQTAVASVRESEYRAATISWIAAGVVAVLGIFAWQREGQSRSPRGANEHNPDTAPPVRDQSAPQL